MLTTKSKACLTNALASKPGAEVERWLKRAQLQLEFALEFSKLFPDKTDQWAPLIQSAGDLINQLPMDSGVSGLKSAVLEAEHILSVVGVTAKSYVLHCVGHGHIDMNWMWSWPETVETTYNTFASVLSLMEEYPDLTYSQSQASVYALVEQHFPEMFETIKMRVLEGRWEVTASHWVEGDKNLASGESLCRHLLHTRRYFQTKFGLSADDLPIDWEPDTFGHAATIPSIVAQGGVKYYYSCRQGGGFNQLQVGDTRPPVFYWQGPDGARVLVNRETTWYNSYVNIEDNIALPLVHFARQTTLNHWLNVYGIGNHGGGPTRAEIDYLHEAQQWPIYPKIEFSTAKRYFDTIQSQITADRIAIPTIDHELNFEFTGCYTSQSLIKQANRLGENALEEAETLGLLAHCLANMSYPASALREAWLKVLFNQFHDILPGSGVRQTREHALGTSQEAIASASSVKKRACTALFEQINTKLLLDEADSSANARAVALYNPVSWTRSERMSIDIYDAKFNPRQVVVLDGEGNRVQALCTEEETVWGHDRQRFEFDVKNLPALGYRTVVLEEGIPDPGGDTVRALGQDWFETPFLKFRLDRYRSGLLELIDKRTGAILIHSKGQLSDSSPLGAVMNVLERSRGMTSWCLGEEASRGAYLQSEGLQILGIQPNVATDSVASCSSSGLKIVTRLRLPGTKSRVKLTTTINTLEPRIDFEAEIDWYELGNETDGIPGLTVSFPLALREITSRYETPFGSLQRALFSGEEVPTLRYAHVSGMANTTDGSETKAGFTLLQDCKYGHSIRGSELRMRLLRSTFDPDPAPEVSKSSVRYSIYLHTDDATPARLAQLGAAWNHPPIVFGMPSQEGAWPLQQSFIDIQPNGVLLTAMKQTEDGGGLMLRVVECDGNDSEVQIALDEHLIRGLRTARQLDVLERFTSEPAHWAEGILRFKIPANGIVSVGLFPE